MSNYGKIEPNDILNRETYRLKRKDLRSLMVSRKKNRRVDIGPYITVYFENRQTILHQINEMVFIENGGDEQIRDEIEAYKSLIPNGRELIVTLMVEIDNPIKRAEVLDNLGGIEQQIMFKLDGRNIKGEAELDVDRTTADGKASSVQFIHFNFNEDDIVLFKNKNADIRLEINHKNYRHSSGLRADVIEELKADFIL